jgi:hypothetical protein
MLTPTNFQTGDTTMTRTSLVAMTIVTLCVASSAFAQSVDDNAYLNRPRPTIVRMDPLDPVSRVAMLATRANGDVIAAPAPLPSSIVYFAPPAPPAPMAQPQATQIVEERPAGPSRFFSALNWHQRGSRGVARSARRVRARHRGKRVEELLQRAVKEGVSAHAPGRPPYEWSGPFASSAAGFRLSALRLSASVVCPGAQLHALHFSAVPRVALQVLDQGRKVVEGRRAIVVRLGLPVQRSVDLV